MEEKINNNNLLSSLYKDYVLNKLLNNKNRGFNLSSNNNNIINNSINNINIINNENSIIIDNSNKDDNNINNINSTKISRINSMANQINICFDDIDENDDFYKIYIERLNDIKKNSTSKFSNLIVDYDKSYNNYKDKVSKYIEKIDNNLSKLNIIKNDDALLNHATKTLFKKLDYLNHIYCSITKNIEDNFELLNKFLNEEKMIEQNNSIEYFLKEFYDQIFNCSLLNKINFKPIDMSKIANLTYYKYFLHILSKIKKDKSYKKFTINQNNLKEGKNITFKYFHQLKKIKMVDINSKILKDILNEIYNNQIKNKSNSLKKFVLNNCDLKKEIKNIEYIKFNKIEKLKINSGCLNILFLPDLFLASTTNLKSLSLEKVNMSNIGLSKLLTILQKYFKSLEYLSLARNSITEIKNIFNTEKNQSKSFSNLKYFNLHKNSIYNFEISLEKFPQMKLLDLTNNSFNNNYTMTQMIKNKNNLVLFNNNIFISNCEENNNIYIDYLQKRLKDFNFKLKILHLCFAYDEKELPKFEKLKLSPSIKISLIKLDLSFCGLKTDSIIKFLKNNYGLFSLKVLNLKYNNIESNIFEEFVCDDEINLEKLTSLNLSENQINCQKYEENEYLIKFIEKFEKLEVIKLYFCAFFNLWNMNISPEVNHDGKLRKLYEGFKDYLNKKNRKFVFQIDKNKNCYIEKRFDGLFEFK